MIKQHEKMLKAIARKKSKVFSITAKSDNEIAKNIKTGSTGFLQLPEWKLLRSSVVAHYGGRCMKCKIIPKDHRKINVDHIKPRKYYPDLSLVFDNLQVLCNRCNKDKGNKHMTDYRGQTLAEPMELS